MDNLNPSMRLKVKRDTFVLPDGDGGVYLRNNVSSFHMKGSYIDQWVSKLIPMFNGEYTLNFLTSGLPGPYRDRVYEIASVLHKNGFVRDISEDRPHQLPDYVLKNYAGQIQFLESYGDSPAFRYQVYRQSKILAIGSGPLLVSLAASFLETGLPKLHLLVTETMPTNRKRLEEIVEHARKNDPEAQVEEVSAKGGPFSWSEAVQPFDLVLYVSQEADIGGLRTLHKICREKGKLFIPAVFLGKKGWAGPLTAPESEGCWESAWRSIHQTVFSESKESGFTGPAGAMLANVAVFECFKYLTGAKVSDQIHQLYLLDSETLEGRWHPFLPHPLVSARRGAEHAKVVEVLPSGQAAEKDTGTLLLYLAQLTSKECGLFHQLDEGDLMQLPLSQCAVQVVDPLSDGPAALLPRQICAELTHEKARKAAGLAGIEAYAERMAQVLLQDVFDKGTVDLSREFVGIGAGETAEEAICRALEKCLNEEFRRVQLNAKEVGARPVQVTGVESGGFLYYLQSLTVLQGPPVIGMGKEVCGFPVAWVGTSRGWHGYAGLTATSAVEHALVQALAEKTGRTAKRPVTLENSTAETLSLSDTETYREVLEAAVRRAEQNGKRLLLVKFSLEPVLRSEMVEVYGVLLREEEEI